MKNNEMENDEAEYLEALEKLDGDDKFKLWCDKITPLIKEIIGRKNKVYEHESTVLGDNSEANIKSLEVSFKQKQKQMKEGEIIQAMIGNWDGWEDLKTGHPSGLDCRKIDNSMIIEGKNKYNTCNSGSEKFVKDKLSIWKKENPNTRCILGIANPKPGCKKLSKIIMHNGVEIEKIQGEELFKLVFTIGSINYSKKVIEFARASMDLAD